MHSEVALPALAQLSSRGNAPKPLQLVMLARAAHRAAREFHLISRDFRHLGEHVRSIEDVLHDRDETGAPVERLAVGPLQGVSIALGAELGCIAHAIDAAATRIGLYRLPVPHAHLEPVAGRLARLCGATAEAVASAVERAESRELEPLIARIGRLSVETLIALRCAAEDLAESPDKDPLTRIMWQEIYDRLEAAARKCGAVAAILGNDCAAAGLKVGRSDGEER